MTDVDHIESSRMLLAKTTREMAEIGHSPATGGNYSLKVSATEILITASGKDKRTLQPADTILVDLDGKPLQPGKPSDETLLHCQIYRELPQIHAVVHTHTVYATILSEYFRLDGKIEISGLEMIKSIEGFRSHEETLSIPLYPNSQNIPVLTREIHEHFANPPVFPGYLLSGHGLYTWGKDLFTAKRHAEGIEFLLECKYRQLSLL